MSRVLAFAYGSVCYLLFFGTFVYTVGWLGNFGTPTQIDRIAQVDAGAQGSVLAAVAINLGLLTLFALQHSVMARPGFKRWWTRIVPRPVERSTYVLFTVAALALIFWQWRPITGVVWEAQGAAAVALTGLYLAGYAIVFYSTVLISHFDLFGMRQVTLFARGQEYRHLPFDTPQVYKKIRHPLYVGWFTVFWATPVMTWGHLLFAATCTAYILVAIQLEERDLVSYFGETYARYRRQVPMFIPRPGRRAERPEVQPVPATR